MRKKHTSLPGTFLTLSVGMILVVTRISSAQMEDVSGPPPVSNSVSSSSTSSSISSGPVEGMEFVSIPAGSFYMGSPSSDSERYDDEVRHLVTIGSFELMTTEVTQGMWEEVMGEDIRYLRDEANPDWTLRGEGNDYPVYYVSWNDCQEFIDRLNVPLGDG